MAHPVWPLFDLRVTTPRLELRTIDDESGVALAELAAHGVHDPTFMPFVVEWTDVAPPQQQRNTLQWYWHGRASWQPHEWRCEFAVFVDGEVVGTTGLMANRFSVLRSFETGSWLGRAHQGRGIGREMREACLHFGFAGLDARWATTSAFWDNGPSLGVTRRLGYEPDGTDRKVRRGEAAESLRFRMSHDHWASTLRRDDIEIHGLDACREMFGI